MGHSLERCLTGRELSRTPYAGRQSRGHKLTIVWKLILA